MAISLNPCTSFQQAFHERWGFLNDPHVRSLAWLLDAPNLLDASAALWKGRIATLEVERARTRRWLGSLDTHPEELHASLNLHASCRLGRYAERLMSFYFRHEGNLLAQGVQLRGANQQTIGEFDFLLRRGDAVYHLELATKFYLLASQTRSSDSARGIDYFIGPNLADTLGLKMKKIIDRQLMLGQHPYALEQLPWHIGSAQALIKGWLFYHENETLDTKVLGVSNEHCKGFWCTISELEERPGRHYAVLPRLAWLPPVKSHSRQAKDRRDVIRELRMHFQNESMPVLVAALDMRGDHALETERGFIVPDDWQTRACQSKASLE